MHLTSVKNNEPDEGEGLLGSETKHASSHMEFQDEIVMSKLRGAGDAAGGPGFGNNKYLGLLVATEGFIDKTMLDIGHYKRPKQSGENKKFREEIISRLNFNAEESLAFCIRIDRDIIIDEVLNTLKIRKKKIKRPSISRAYDKILFNSLKKYFEIFALQHDMHFNEVTIESDGDCYDIFRHNNITFTRPKNAHNLADIISHANVINSPPKGVRELDLTNVIRKRLKSEKIKASVPT